MSTSTRSSQLAELKRSYLTMYNLAQASAWAYIFGLAFKPLQKGSFKQAALQEVFPTAEFVLEAAQGLAIAEIAHAIFGLVRSNPTTTFVQVGASGPGPGPRARNKRLSDPSLPSGWAAAMSCSPCCTAPPR